MQKPINSTPPENEVYMVISREDFQDIMYSLEISIQAKTGGLQGKFLALRRKLGEQYQATRKPNLNPSSKTLKLAL